ncbi:MAG: hypothetical protein CM15mP103_02650 [Gammaproteobacteria bacterium]|nr:MAG: hypothetical protein CM15mP103_02650 [Gammaproteobacteria bacterium]
MVGNPGGPPRGVAHTPDQCLFALTGGDKVDEGFHGGSGPGIETRHVRWMPRHVGEDNTTPVPNKADAKDPSQWIGPQIFCCRPTPRLNGMRMTLIRRAFCGVPGTPGAPS